MRWYQISFYFTFIAITLCYALKPAMAQAQFQSPDNITLTMYRLVQGSGSLLLDPDTQRPIPCTMDDPIIAQSYGCTAITSNPNYAYPFDTSVITIGMEGHIHNGVQQGYLHNVVPSEMNPQNRNALAVRAQAIAARTFAYFEIAFPTCSDGQAAPMAVTVQNTGIQNWNVSNDVRFDVDVTFLGGGGLSASATTTPVVQPLAAELVDIGMGNTWHIPFSYTFTDVGRYRILFDMEYQGRPFAALAAETGKEWFNFVREIATFACERHPAVYAPLVMSTDLATESSH